MRACGSLWTPTSVLLILLPKSLSYPISIQVYRSLYCEGKQCVCMHVCVCVWGSTALKFNVQLKSQCFPKKADSCFFFYVNVYFFFSLRSAHLRAVPDRGLGVRSVHPGGLSGRRVLLPLPPPQTGTVIRRCDGRRSGRWPPPGNHPDDVQRGDLQGFIVPPVQYSHLFQLLCPAHCPPPWSPGSHAGPGLLLPAPRCQRLRQHAH